MGKTLYLVWQVDSVDNETLMEVFDNEELARQWVKYYERYRNYNGAYEYEIRKQYLMTMTPEQAEMDID